TLAYVVVLKLFGNAEWGPLITAYLGLILLGSSFIAIGMLSSSLARNQIVAAVIGIGILLLLWIMGAAASVLGPRMGAFLAYLSLNDHFNSFQRGVIDLKDLIFYLSMTAGALFLTIRALESNRWRA
ncbi:MAG TPA: ABC transporter permease, partial [Chloroflexota bacterium]|nr:ABC transporter permease [Chloroflexota bacterium]